MTYKTRFNECLELFQDSFMKPQLFRGGDIHEILMHEGLDIEDDAIYARLSASGFMDKTDMGGPFKDVAEACDYLEEMYL